MRDLDDIPKVIALWILRAFVFVTYSLNLLELWRHYVNGLYRSSLIALHLLVLLAIGLSASADVGLFYVSFETRRLMLLLAMAGFGLAGRKMIKDYKHK